MIKEIFNFKVLMNRKKKKRIIIFFIMMNGYTNIF